MGGERRRGRDKRMQNEKWRELSKDWRCFLFTLAKVLWTPMIPYRRSFIHSFILSCWPWSLEWPFIFQGHFYCPFCVLYCLLQRPFMPANACEHCCWYHRWLIVVTMTIASGTCRRQTMIMIPNILGGGDDDCGLGWLMVIVPETNWLHINAFETKKSDWSEWDLFHFHEPLPFLLICTFFSCLVHLPFSLSSFSLLFFHSFIHILFIFIHSSFSFRLSPFFSFSSLLFLLRSFLSLLLPLPSTSCRYRRSSSTLYPSLFITTCPPSPSLSSILFLFLTPPSNPTRHPFDQKKQSYPSTPFPLSPFTSHSHLNLHLHFQSPLFLLLGHLALPTSCPFSFPHQLQPLIASVSRTYIHLVYTSLHSTHTTCCGQFQVRVCSPDYHCPDVPLHQPSIVPIAHPPLLLLLCCLSLKHPPLSWPLPLLPSPQVKRSLNSKANEAQRLYPRS